MRGGLSLFLVVIIQRIVWCAHKETGATARYGAVTPVFPIIYFLHASRNGTYKTSPIESSGT